MGEVVGFFKDALAPTSKLFIALKETTFWQGDVIEGEVVVVCKISPFFFFFYFRVIVFFNIFFEITLCIFRFVFCVLYIVLYISFTLLLDGVRISIQGWN